MDYSFASACTLPTVAGRFEMRVYKHHRGGADAIALVTRVAHGANRVRYTDIDVTGIDAAAAVPDGVLVRVQDQCMTSEIFGSVKCDCKQQLDHSMELLQQAAVDKYAAWKASEASTQSDGASTMRTASIAASGSVDSDSDLERQAVDDISVAGSASGEPLLPLQAAHDGPSLAGTGARPVQAQASQPSRPPACLDEIAGVLVYLLQEGRGIGLAAKVAAYALQEQPQAGHDHDDEDDGHGHGPHQAHGLPADLPRQPALPDVSDVIAPPHAGGEIGALASPVPSAASTASSVSALTPSATVGSAWLGGGRPRGRGLDTVDANRALGLPDDAREYGAVRDILQDLGLVKPGESGAHAAGSGEPASVVRPSGAGAVPVPQGCGHVEGQEAHQAAHIGQTSPCLTSTRPLVLLTNNPRKLRALSDLGIPLAGRLACAVKPVSHHAAAYLKAKAERMGHMLPAGVLAVSTAVVGGDRQVTAVQGVGQASVTVVPHNLQAQAGATTAS